MICIWKTYLLCMVQVILETLGFHYTYFLYNIRKHIEQIGHSFCECVRHYNFWQHNETWHDLEFLCSLFVFQCFHRHLECEQSEKKTSWNQNVPMKIKILRIFVKLNGVYLTTHSVVTNRCISTIGWRTWKTRQFAHSNMFRYGFNFFGFFLINSVF